MKSRLLGRTGVSVSEMGLGAMMFGASGNNDHDDSIRIIHAALDAGINFIDTANVYARDEVSTGIGMTGWSSMAMAARLWACGLVRLCSGILPSLLCRCTAFARRLGRGTQLAVARVEKSLGSDNLMTCFHAEPTWRGSDPVV
jgi:hypothetical protein